MSAEEVPGRRTVSRVLVGSAVVMVVYWALWFAARGVVASNDRPAYREFENAFPLADAWVTWCLLAAWWSLRRGRPAAVLWLLVGGGAGIYLFGLDVLYDLEQGIWWRSGVGGVVELGVNALTLAVSLGLLTWTWRHRTALLAGHRPEPTPTPAGRTASSGRSSSPGSPPGAAGGPPPTG